MKIHKISTVHFRAWHFTFEPQSLLLYEGVGNRFHAVNWTDEYDCGAAADRQPEVPRVLRQLVRVIGISGRKCIRLLSHIPNIP